MYPLVPDVFNETVEVDEYARAALDAAEDREVVLVSFAPNYRLESWVAEAVLNMARESLNVSFIVEDRARMLPKELHKLPNVLFYEG